MSWQLNKAPSNYSKLINLVYKKSMIKYEMDYRTAQANGSSKLSGNKKMRLNTLIKLTKETKSEFLARTKWFCGDWRKSNKVFVYKNEKCSGSAKMMDEEKAKIYMQTLYDDLSEPERQILNQEQQQKPKHELMKIEEEIFETEKIVKTVWIDSVTGEVCHKFGG